MAWCKCPACAPQRRGSTGATPALGEALRCPHRSYKSPWLRSYGHRFLMTGNTKANRIEFKTLRGTCYCLVFSSQFLGVTDAFVSRLYIILQARVSVYLP